MKNKNTLKILDKAIELAKLLIELQKSKQVPIPDYKKGCKSVKIICDDSIDKNENFVCDGKNTPLSNFQKLRDETKQDFHKGMIDAEKELQRVCKENKVNIISLFDTTNDILKNESLFVVNESGERTKIKLSYSSGDNLIFKNIPEPPRQMPNTPTRDTNTYL